MWGGAENSYCMAMLNTNNIPTVMRSLIAGALAFFPYSICLFFWLRSRPHSSSQFCNSRRSGNLGADHVGIIIS